MSRKITIGSVGVDSGQLLITDPCYLEEWGSNEYEETRVKEMKNGSDFSYDYSGCCARTLSEQVGGNIGRGTLGVALATAWGDGKYDIVATVDKDGSILKIEIDFDN